MVITHVLKDDYGKTQYVIIKDEKKMGVYDKYTPILYITKLNRVINYTLERYSPVLVSILIVSP